MSHPLYVLLPEGADWSDLAGTTAQRPAPVRWYLRQQMPDAVTSVAVLVDEGADRDLVISQVADRAQELGGVTVDAATQQIVEPAHSLG